MGSVDRPDWRLQAEIEVLSWIRQQMHAEEAWYHSVVDTVADAVITIDPQGVIVAFNRTAQKMFQRELEDVLGRAITAVLGLDRAVFRFAPGERLETEVRRADGSSFPVEVIVGEVGQ